MSRPYSPATDATPRLAINDSPVQIEEARGKRYLGDICTRCGKWQPAHPPQETPHE